MAFAGTADQAVAPRAYNGHEAAFTGPYRDADARFPRPGG
jgi:hypothetical protein